MTPPPVLFVNGSPSSLEGIRRLEACLAAFAAHFPDGEVVDMATAVGRDRMAEILKARREGGGGVTIDIFAR